MKARNTTVAAAFAALSLGLGACAQWGTRPGIVEAPSISVNATRSSMYTGEKITLVADTRNLGTRDIDIKWTASAGEIEQDPDGRVARLHVTEPGPVIVRAMLMDDDDRVIASDTQQIEVLGLRPDAPK